MRLIRRRLGLSQRELAYLIGYDSDSQISHIENGLRTPQLAEVLIIELLFGVPAVIVFDQIRLAVAEQVNKRLNLLLSTLSMSSGGHNRRLSYKTAQLESVLASLGSRYDFDLADDIRWHIKK